MFRTTLRVTLSAVALLCAITVAVPASADVIYDNGSPDLNNAYLSDLNLTGISAEDFMLNAGSETITDIHWWGVYEDNQSVTDDFTIKILGDNGGLPDAGNVLLGLSAGDVAQTATGDRVIGTYDLYEYSLDIDPLTLTAGQTYYLVIANNVGTPHSWFWATSFDGSGTHYRDSSVPYGDVFLALPSELAFTLTNDNLNEALVPEPASVSLLGLGLAGLAARRLRKRA